MSAARVHSFPIAAQVFTFLLLVVFMALIFPQQVLLKFGFRVACFHSPAREFVTTVRSDCTLVRPDLVRVDFLAPQLCFCHHRI
jgi:hypothetical protein